MSEQDWHYNAQCAEAQFEAEVERLTRECLDREATETDARERLRRCEERLAAVEALIPLWESERYPDTGDPGWNNGYDMRREVDVECLQAALAGESRD